MPKMPVTIILITSLFLYTACASNIPGIQLHQVKDYEYDDIQGAGKVFVTTAEDFKHEIIQFKFTDDHLTGKEIIKMNGSEPIKVRLGFIKSLEVEGFRDEYGKIFTKQEIEMNIITNKRKGKAITGALTSSLFYALPILGIYVYAMSSIETSGSIIEKALANLTLLGGVALVGYGGYKGYKNGKNEDIKIAIKRIKKKREAGKK